MQGSAGKSLMIEITHQDHTVSTGSVLGSVAMKVASVMPVLLLQKSNQKMKLQKHITCSEQHLWLWENGWNFELVSQGRPIQSHFPKVRSLKGKNQLSQSIVKLMIKSKPLCSCCQAGQVKVLNLHDTISHSNSTLHTVRARDALTGKHPPSQPVYLFGCDYLWCAPWVLFYCFWLGWFLS